MSERFAAVVLAAGASTRMGASRNKLLEPVAGEPIVRRAVHALADPRITDRIVVTGADAERVCAALAGTGVRFVHNPEFAMGIASSIRTGIEAVTGNVDGALILPGDMPLLDGADVSALLDAFDPAAGRSVCHPVFAGRRGNPVLWGARHFDALRALEGDTGGRQLFDRLPDPPHAVPAHGAGVLVDVDTPEALEDVRHGGGA